MKALNKATQKVLDRLFADLAVGSAKVVDNAPGAFMALHVDRLAENRFSLAHYFTQNGDRVSDPDMELWRGPDGLLYPVALQQSTGFYTRAIEFGQDGKPSGVRPRANAELVSFATMWVRNLRHQQGV